MSSPETPPARGTSLLRQSQRRPARLALSPVAYTDWVPGDLYDDQLPFRLHYLLEWKLTLNKRTVAKQTEKDLGIAPSGFWNEEYSYNIADIAQSTGKVCEPSATIIVLSMNERNDDAVNSRE